MYGGASTTVQHNLSKYGNNFRQIKNFKNASLIYALLDRYVVTEGTTIH